MVSLVTVVTSCVVTVASLLLLRWLVPLTWLQERLRAVVCSGSVPRHVAIIMDGNRRYAVNHGMQRSGGHVHGFSKLKKALEWCYDLGVHEVTLYAFSIENFKRPQEEVSTLMDLAHVKIKKLLAKDELVQKYGVCLRVLGDLQLLPTHLRRRMADAVLRTANNDQCVLNVCFAYTAREEMVRATKWVASGVAKGLLQPHDITTHVWEQCLYTDSEPDLVIRTSGETRLSDFLLWQASFSPLLIYRVLWPDFTFWHLCHAILLHQRCVTRVREEREAHTALARAYEEASVVRGPAQQHKERVDAFVRWVHDERLRQWHVWAAEDAAGDAGKQGAPDAGKRSVSCVSSSCSTTAALAVDDASALRALPRMASIRVQ